MKSHQTNLVITTIILANFAVACSMFGGSNSNVANNSTAANTNVNNVPAAKNEDLPMLSAPKLFEMLVADPVGLNQRLKGKEIIVLGVLKDTMNGISLMGGPATIKTIYCDMEWKVSADSDEKYQKLNNLPSGEKKPIVEVKCVYSEGKIFKDEGIPSASIFLSKCTIVSIE